MKRLLRISVPALISAWPLTVAAQTSTSEALQKAAEGGGAAASASATMMGGTSLLDIFVKGGPMLYPLVALSFVGVVLVLVCTLTLRQGTVVTNRFLDVAESMMRKQDYLGLAAMCNRSGQSVARVIQRAMDFLGRNPGATVEQVREVAQAEGVRQASMMTQRISYLADIGSISPMVGLLGTVLGMLKSFDTLSGGSFVEAKTHQLASGVAEALINTAGGLFIGIPALAFYALFRGKVQKLISELEASTTHLMAMFAVDYDASAQRLPVRQARRSRPVSPAESEDEYADEESAEQGRRR